MPQIPTAAHRDDDLLRAGLPQVDLDDLERLSDGPEERRAGLQDSAAFTAAQSVTTQTFVSA